MTEPGSRQSEEWLPPVLSSRTVYEGRVIDLRVEEIALPGGRRALREVVKHPGAVVIVALDQDERVTLVRQYRHPVRRWLLELPAGGLEPGEDPLQAARRELREEVGLEAQTWRPLGSFFSSPGFADELLHAYLARDLLPSPLDPDDDEDITVVRHSLDELLAHPELVPDAKTLAALFLAGRCLGKIGEKLSHK